jgi:hypothetical protein
MKGTPDEAQWRETYEQLRTMKANYSTLLQFMATQVRHELVHYNENWYVYCNDDDSSMWNQMSAYVTKVELHLEGKQEGEILDI